MDDLFTTDELSQTEKENILKDIRPQIESLNLEQEAKTCGKCKNTIRLSDRNATAFIALGTFTGWKGAPSSEIDKLYCSKHKPNPNTLLQKADEQFTIRNKIVVATVTEENNTVTIESIAYADSNPL